MDEFDRRVTNAFRELGDALGCEIKRSAAGAVKLAFQDGLVCTIEAPSGGNHVFFLVPAGRATGADRLAVLTASLHFNLFGLRRPGAWLALDPETDELTLCAVAHDSEIEASAIAAILTDLHEEAKRVGDLLRNPEGPLHHSDPAIDSEPNRIWG